MTTLERTTFEISRAAEYFKDKELEAQTGQPLTAFAAVVLKELVDNALDAAEKAGVAPEISIEVVSGTPLLIRVTDNGPGIPADTVTRILNFDTRTSDKSAYRSPTRGAQGNAFKTVLGIPYALGGKAPLIVEALNIRHTIEAQAGLAGTVRILPKTSECVRPVGTMVVVTLPSINGQSFRPVRWAEAFSLFNPHASVRIRQCEEGGYHANSGTDGIGGMGHSYRLTVDFPSRWRKFLPTNPTSAWWYTFSDFASLIALYNAAAHRGARPLTLRDFVKQFRGLTANQKAKMVCDQFEQTHLADFDSDPKAVERLLDVMCRSADPPLPEVLGQVGKHHFETRFSEWYGVNRCWYRKVEGNAEGIPFLFEVMVAETENPGDHFTGVNFSPTFTDPFSDTFLSVSKDDWEISGEGLRNFFANCHVWPTLRNGRGGSYTASAAHLVCPSLNFLDRGKTHLKVPRAIAAAVAEATWKACQEIYREEERRRKDAAREHRRSEQRAKEEERERERQARAETQPERQESKKRSLVEIVFDVLPEALEKASGGGQYPVSARTLYYQVRPLIQPHTGKELEYGYFSQRLLTRYRQEVGPLEGLYYDPRGVLYEPHGGEEVPLGTREVDAYNFPTWRYNKILYIEKKGLWHQIKQAQLGERYDMAVIAAEGYATEAARLIFSQAEKGQEYRLFVLHDADPYGYDIARTLQSATERMPDYNVDAVDLGLKFDHAVDLGIEPEQFTRKDALSEELLPHLSERERTAFIGRAREVRVNGERKQHYSCERVELNALTAPQLLAYIEQRLVEEGADNKVIPPDDILADHFRGSYSGQLHELVEKAVDQAVNQALRVGNLKYRIAQQFRVSLDASQVRQWVEDGLKSDRSSSWYGPLSWKASGIVRDIDKAALRSAIVKEIKRRLPRGLESPEALDDCERRAIDASRSG